MKEQYNTRFLKPTTSMVNESNSVEFSDLGAFRWKVLTDQAARDKISHALRTSAGACRKRQERRQQMKAAKQAQQNTHKQQLAYSPPQSMHISMQSSFVSIPEAPHSHLWHGYSQTTPDLHKYEPMLPMSSMVSFDGSVADMTSMSSQQCFVDETNVWHTNSHWNDIWSFEPLPLSSLGSSTISTEMATSISELFCDDSD